MLGELLGEARGKRTGRKVLPSEADTLKQGRRRIRV
jgi:hypothetical protein